ncbi:hypothetical protein [Flavobacterium sp. LC2016-01]|uniref:hypothetical protein n=1 Tax=Flavobacterium sp. LC2016-01 TaxID=2675876 RepID=UPI0012BABE31|nr:hypothetical protein [Flavobacterium sp. LC2016-01]MTH17754.1 hypothetical protein [Flavobacterium sp. LC2016-01]
MKRIIICVPILILFIQSCQNKDSNQLKSGSIVKSDSVNKEEVNSGINAKEEIELVKSFMKWYIKNVNTLYKFNTIGGGANVAENEEPQNYFVNFSEVEKYIVELKKSGFLTENFLKNEKQIFIEGEKYFKENPENDGPPYGFDYDRFFFTQEAFEEDLPNIDKSKYVVNQKGEFNSEVKFYLPICGITYKYSLKKVNEKWFIDKIESVDTL